MKRSTNMNPFRTAAALAVAGALLTTNARADGVAQIMTSKSIPAATVACIDPEGGGCTGCDPGCACGGPGCCCSDVLVGAGDIILFRFNYFPVPDKIIHGLQGYLTEYVPPNTEVVGMRLITPDNPATPEEEQFTIEPKFPGISVDHCSAPCSNFNSVPCFGTAGGCNLDNGSISQVYADTGIFYTTDARLGRNPNNAFLTLKNGILMVPEPVAAGSIKGILGTDSPIYAHNAWDWIQVRAYGTAGSHPPSNYSENDGKGNTPYNYGSVVAGPQTHYEFEATEVAPDQIEFNDVVGPWQRVAYPGSQIGTGIAATGTTGPLQRVNVDTALGFDLTPNNPLPAGTKAVRVAMGEVRVGEPGRAEVALRVLGTPLDTVQMQDMDCGEVFGGDTSAATENTRAKDNPWPQDIASPACVFLNLLFDSVLITPANKLATVGQTLTYQVHGKNLSINPQTNVVVKQKFESNKTAFVSATGGATIVGNCDGDGFTCLVWPTMTLQPSDEYTFTATFTVGGGGHVTNVVRANYRSDQLPAPGFTTQDVSMAKGVTVVQATLASATASATSPGTADLVGTVRNDGNEAGTFDTITVVLPTGWTVAGPGPEEIIVGAQTLSCSASCGTNAPEFDLGSSFTPGDSRPLSFSVNVPAATATGLYPVDLQIWASQSGFGGAFESYFKDAAFVAVGEPRSDAPVITCPISSTATSVSGTTTEADGTVIRLYLSGIERGSAVASGGTWTVINLNVSFGELYGGLEVRATAEAPSEQESLKSTACFTTTVPICSDFADNDGDGLIDFPADPGCDSALDSDETNPIYECSDLIDNDVPPDGFIDYPDDLSCYGPDDDDESGPPQCSDTVDNDGDGDIDFNAVPGLGDSGCTDALDANEIDFAVCQDGIDNDIPADGLADFPADPGCHSANDDDETDPPPFDPLTDDIRARLLIAFDTSGSMNWNTCNNTFTGGDGSADCAGSDVACCPAMTCCDSATCGDGIANDSRLLKVKGGVADAVSAFGEVDYGLMRFHQREVAWSCPTSNASRNSGGWQGAGASPCSGGFNAGDLLVGYAGDNNDDILEYMDGETNYPGTPPPGQDVELRGSGTTPLGGILTSAQNYVNAVRAGDAIAVCRPYRVILVTDGAETCGGDPAAVAASLCAAGIAVDVIGFSTTDPTVQSNLNSIANAGCDATCDPDYGGPNQVCQDTAVLADDEAELSAAIGRVVSSSILRELCNGLDDNCNGLTDEDFPGVFPPPGVACDNGELGACFANGNIVCLDLNTAGCDAPPGTPTAEVCEDLIDQDCNGIIDDGGCVPCVPGIEICNGADDNCDAQTDESPVPGEGSLCGVDTGACQIGALQCVSGVLDCVGDTGPGLEICDDIDNNCDGITDSFSQACYSFGDGGCVLGVGCTGECRLGIETCTEASAGTFGPCTDEVGSTTDICNSLDDDCDGPTDEDYPGLGTACDNGLDGICAAPGFIVCTMDGTGTECNAPVLPPSPEICNDVDDDCNGLVNDDVTDPSFGLPCGGAMCGGTVQCVCDPFPPAPNDHTGCSLICVGGGTGAEVCDNLDNDCDGFTDESPLPFVGDDCYDPGFGPPIADTGACEFGENICQNGMIVCQGYVGPIPEACNGIDDNCDTFTDNDAECPVDSICYQGACIPACNPELEFQCTQGRVCLPYMGENYCFPDPCLSAPPPCPNGSLVPTDPDTCSCVDPCLAIECFEHQTCVDGSCVDCRDPRFGGCDPTEICVRDEDLRNVCEPDACLGIDCKAGESCIKGQCIGECDPRCGDNELCVGGACCAVDNRECDGVGCLAGQVCNPADGSCIPDPCVQTKCQSNATCRVGCGGQASCERDITVRDPEFVLIAGEGGCGCRVGGESTGGANALLGGLLLALVAWRRRRQP